MQSLLGRTLFALIFLSSALNKVKSFGSDGGPAAQYMAPKLSAFKVCAECNGARRSAASGRTTRRR